VGLRSFLVGEHLAAGGDRTRRDQLGTGREVQAMANPADMHELGENPPARLVHRIGHLAPAADLLR
jgi:hypothetical protein